MIFYRLESLGRSTAAEAFTGEGGLYAAGRWNSLGTRIVYASSSVALACLETLTHMRRPRHLEERWVYSVAIPDELVAEMADLPEGWDVEPAGAASRKIGDEWVVSARSVALLAPSVIVQWRTMC